MRRRHALAAIVAATTTLVACSAILGIGDLPAEQGDATTPDGHPEATTGDATGDATGDVVPSDAGADTDSGISDVGSDALFSCEAVCDAGQCVGGTCVITGGAGQIACPPQVPCRVLCSGSACTAGITCSSSSCEIQCDGGACNGGTIQCSGATCAIGCFPAPNSTCQGVAIFCDASTCNLDCAGGNTCQGGVNVWAQTATIECAGGGACNNHVVNCHGGTTCSIDCQAGACNQKVCCDAGTCSLDGGNNAVQVAGCP
jgi:hypothetical protein